MTRIVLALADRLRAVLAAAGVDYPLFRLLLETRLQLDRRRPQPHFNLGSTAASPDGDNRRIALFFQLIFGGVMTLMVAVSPPLVGLGIVHAFVMLMLGLTLLSEFSTVLHDPADDVVLGALPIDGRTALAARAFFAGSFIAVNAACLGGPAAVVGFFRGSVAYFPAYILSLALNAVLTLLLVHLVYLVTMSFCAPQRFREVMNVVQIVLSIAFSACYILMPRLIEGAGGQVTGAVSGWFLALPPAWLAALPALALGAPGEPRLIAAAIAGVVAPVIGLFLVLRVLAPVYRRRLSLSGSPRSSARARRPRREPLLDRVAVRWLEPECAAAFRVVSALVARDRSFRLRVYPVLAMFVMAFAINPLLAGGPGSWLEDLRDGQGFVLMLYGAVFAGTSPLLELVRGDAPAAAWIWQASPFARAGQILTGALLAIVRRFTLPLLGLAALGTVAVWGPRRIPDVVLAFCTVPLVLGGLAALQEPRLPFSRPPAQQSQAQMASLIGTTLLVGVIGGAHFVMTLFAPWLLLPAAALLLALGVPLVRRTARTPWADVVP